MAEGPDAQDGVEACDAGGVDVVGFLDAGGVAEIDEVADFGIVPDELEGEGGNGGVVDLELDVPCDFGVESERSGDAVELLLEGGHSQTSCAVEGDFEI